MMDTDLGLDSLCIENCVLVSHMLARRAAVMGWLIMRGIMLLTAVN